MSTMPAVDALFSRKICPGDQEHAHLIGGRAHGAQVYPPQLCKAIVAAIKLQKRWDAVGLKLLATIEAEGEVPIDKMVPPEEEAANEFLEAWDDVSGEFLDP